VAASPYIYIPISSADAFIYSGKPPRLPLQTPRWKNRHHRYSSAFAVASATTSPPLRHRISQGREDAKIGEEEPGAVRPCKEPEVRPGIWEIRQGLPDRPGVEGSRRLTRASAAAAGVQGSRWFTRASAATARIEGVPPLCCSGNVTTGVGDLVPNVPPGFENVTPMGAACDDGVPHLRSIRTPTPAPIQCLILD
jgi:hypothetical protein